MSEDYKWREELLDHPCYSTICPECGGSYTTYKFQPDAPDNGNTVLKFHDNSVSFTVNVIPGCQRVTESDVIRIEKKVKVRNGIAKLSVKFWVKK